jgi:hypothetical protein
MKLTTTDTQALALQKRVNEARANAKTVDVDREALRNLLLDHHAMAGKLNVETER